MQKLQRRPIKLRSAEWSVWTASTLVRAGITPNQVSMMSAVFSLLGAVVLSLSMFVSSQTGMVAALLFAAIFIQSRLLCNMLDGLMAVEHGKATKSGELYNELPDRISDAALLSAAGYAAGYGDFGIVIGWLSACLALSTAYIRAFGARLMDSQDFGGPMAKPQRMFVLTVGSLAAAVHVAISGKQPTLPAIMIALLIIFIGSVYTCVSRVRNLKTAMEKM